MGFSSDDGNDSEEREALASDDAMGEDEYAKALAKEMSLKKAKAGPSLLTDLDTADEETKWKRKIESWCDVTEIKVSKLYFQCPWSFLRQDCYYLILIGLLL